MQNNHREFVKGKEISMGSANAPVLADYMDYREYLADFYKFRRRVSRGSLRVYNYAMFSAAANIKSPNYLKMIIEGKRNLSDDMVTRFGKALGLMKEQVEEFRLLVHFTQATDPADRNMYLKKLSEHRVASKLKNGEIDRKTWEKVPNWVAWIIYAMVDQEGVRFDTQALKNLLRGKAREDEIDQALTTLLEAGELKRDEKTGEIRKNRNLIESPEEVPVALVRKLQSQLMYLGLESLYQDEPTEREFGTLTMSLTRQEFEEIKFKLRQMRKALNKDNTIARMKSKGERVYQLNIQLFPVTNMVEGVEAPATMQVLKPQTSDINSAPATVMTPEAEVSVVAQHAANLETRVSEAIAAVSAPEIAEPSPAIEATSNTQGELAPASAATEQTADKTSEKVGDKKDPAKANVSSLAASAASAADLFR